MTLLEPTNNLLYLRLHSNSLLIRTITKRFFFVWLTMFKIIIFIMFKKKRLGSTYFNRPHQISFSQVEKKRKTQLCKTNTDLL
jgi:hypothetical protein